MLILTLFIINLVINYICRQINIYPAVIMVPIGIFIGLKWDSFYYKYGQF